MEALSSLCREEKWRQVGSAVEELLRDEGTALPHDVLQLHFLQVLALVSILSRRKFPPKMHSPRLHCCCRPLLRLFNRVSFSPTQPPPFFRFLFVFRVPAFPCR
jgi:hypothetical protein